MTTLAFKLEYSDGIGQVNNIHM